MFPRIPTIRYNFTDIRLCLMPFLHFKGKPFLKSYHHTVKFHRLVEQPEKSTSETPSLDDNLIIHGDNLKALKALLPTHAGKIKCIYIDPPYNTGNEGWVYNDNVNSPMIKEWLGQVVAKDDLSRHDKWCCMMYPRLVLLNELLHPDGVIYVSIDDNEGHTLRMLMDEIFNEASYVTTLHVQMSTVQGQKVKPAKKGNIVKNGESVLVYCKSGRKAIGKRVLYDPSGYDTHYSIFLEDEGDHYKEIPLADRIRREEELCHHLDMAGIMGRKKGEIQITNKGIKTAYNSVSRFRNFIHDNAERIVRLHDVVEIPEEHIPEAARTGLVVKYHSSERSYLIGLDGGNELKQRIQLSEKIRQADDFYSSYGVTTIRGDWWGGFYIDMGNVSKEGGVSYGNGKKPVRLVKQLIKFMSEPGSDDIVLDSFAGSGTTGHAVMELNQEDKGMRKFILVQCDETDPDSREVIDVCDKVTRKRIENIAATSAFTYCEIGDPIDTDAMLDGTDLPSFIDLAKYAFFTATGEKLDLSQVDPQSYYVGSSKTFEVFLVYAPDKERLKQLALNTELAEQINERFPSKRKLVFAPCCYLEDWRLGDLNITFAQLPFDIYRLAA